MEVTVFEVAAAQYRLWPEAAVNIGYGMGD